MTNMGFNYSGVELIVNGEKVYLNGDIIMELHKQENIQWGKNIAANYISDERFSTLTDEQFEAIAERLEELEMQENGMLEQQAIEEKIGSIDEEN